MEIQSDDPLAVAIVSAIRRGDVDAVGSLVGEHAELASARIRDADGATRSLLHVVTDWPSYFLNGPQIVRLLIEAGADPKVAVTGSWHAETPLHWAASSDDSDVAAALIDGGSDIEAPGASIAGGTPLDDAVGYGCWHVARLLVERGALVESLWHAAALGMTGRVAELLGSDPPPSSEQIDHAFWQACPRRSAPHGRVPLRPRSRHQRHPRPLQAHSRRDRPRTRYPQRGGRVLSPRARRQIRSRAIGGLTASDGARTLISCPRSPSCSADSASGCGWSHLKRRHVCSLFARLPRYYPSAPGRGRHPGVARDVSDPHRDHP